MSELRLVFQTTPAIHEETNITVRLGEKWLNEWLKSGGPFSAVAVDGEGELASRTPIIVTGVWYLPLCEVKDEWLRFYVDDPGCSWSDLFSRLTHCYKHAAKPDRRAEVSPPSMVSVVLFQR